jgi:ABC-2 type transport system permease protein
MSWRRLRTLVVREVRATLRDPFTLTILIAVPLVALLAFGFVLSTEVKGLRLAVLDGSETPASRRLLADLAAQGTFVPERVATRAALERALVDGTASAGLVIPADFARTLARPQDPRPQVQLLYDGAEAVLAGNAEVYLQALVEASGATLVRGGPPAGAGVRVMPRALFNPTLDGKPFMVAGTFGFVLSFLTILITAVSIVNERLAGTFEQLQVTPATSVEILLGKLLPLGAMFTLDVVLMMLTAGIVLGVWPRGSALLLVAVSAFYVSISLAAGLLISGTSATANEAVQKTVLVSIPLVQLSGFIFPIRSMPAAVQWATTLFPATHYITLTRGIYLRAEGVATLWPELAALLAFGVVLIGFALRAMGRRP